MVGEAVKWRERAERLKALLKEKEEEVKRWAEQVSEGRSVETQTARKNYKSVAVGGDSQALVVAPAANHSGGSTAMVVVPEARKRQPEREGEREGKKQVVDPSFGLTDSQRWWLTRHIKEKWGGLWPNEREIELASRYNIDLSRVSRVEFGDIVWRLSHSP